MTSSDAMWPDPYLRARVARLVSEARWASTHSMQYGRTTLRIRRNLAKKSEWIVTLGGVSLGIWDTDLQNS